MNKLIIRHGERVTEHPIDDHPLVVGRDPQCDLFFADKKLSRRHARFERDGDGIRLVDLGSRNGCWVNEERVEKKLLTPSDAVRLGSLSVTLEAEPEPAERDDQESTVYLSAEPPSDDSGTMVLSSNDLPDAEPPRGAGTVILPPPDTNAPAQDSTTRRVEVGHEDPTLRKPDTVAREAREGSSEQTIMLQGNAPRAATDTGTVIFPGKTAPAMDDATRLAPAGGAAETKMQAPGAPRLPEASPDTSVQPGEQSWDFEPPSGRHVHFRRALSGSWAWSRRSRRLRSSFWPCRCCARSGAPLRRSLRFEAGPSSICWRQPTKRRCVRIVRRRSPPNASPVSQAWSGRTFSIGGAGPRPRGDVR